jgi:Tfp pilus assembly protein PilX
MERRPARAGDDAGSALIMALLATILLTSLGVGLMMLSTTEGAIASNFRASNESLYAADAAV